MKHRDLYRLMSLMVREASTLEDVELADLVAAGNRFVTALSFEQQFRDTVRQAGGSLP